MVWDQRVAGSNPATPTKEKAFSRLRKGFFHSSHPPEYWNEKKSKLKQKFNNLTEEDLCYHEGKEKEMIELLGYKLGISKLELISIVISL